jgi:hypothetical protein
MEILPCALSLLLVASSPEAVPHLRTVRSLAVEAAADIALERRHRLTATYAREARKQIRQKLLSEIAAPDTESAKLAGAALRALDAEDVAALAAIAARIGQEIDS